jgi:hypothetical protein
MATVTKNMRDSTITFYDGTLPTAQSLVLVLEEGDFKFSTTRNVINILDRGVLSHQRPGNEEVVTGSLTIKFVEFIKQSALTTPVPYEVVTHTGAAASWVTTNTDSGDVYNFDMKLDIVDPVSANGNERIVLSKVFVTGVEFGEGDEYNTLAFNFQAFITAPTVSKVAKT